MTLPSVGTLLSLVCFWFWAGSNCLYPWEKAKLLIINVKALDLQSPAAKPLVSIDEIVRNPRPPALACKLSSNGLPPNASRPRLIPVAPVAPKTRFVVVGFPREVLPNLPRKGTPLNGFFNPLKNAIDALVSILPKALIGPVNTPVLPNLPILRPITPSVKRRPLNANLNDSKIAPNKANDPITSRPNLFNATVLPDDKNLKAFITLSPIHPVNNIVKKFANLPNENCAFLPKDLIGFTKAFCITFSIIPSFPSLLPCNIDFLSLVAFAASLSESNLDWTAKLDLIIPKDNVNCPTCADIFVNVWDTLFKDKLFWAIILSDIVSLCGATGLPVKTPEETFLLIPLIDPATGDWMGSAIRCLLCL